ncbi:phosphoribosylamine--glycine ligase [Nitrospina gracilis]|uniref:phosphoribosylamine--glycine ligase n=1 Tax=Nitrospina gracilis TaxID=35801 RepID=UPI001F013866|nr:phosphoribosylamine--glycine ligase [Nitrospina gracilis]MCF8719447.1 phosphoribosylamine--glycine ligase [Nitrospina gracilis Nb-211]
MKILVIGGGGREHALTWKIKQSPLVTEVFCAPGNAGTESIARNIAVSATDLDSLLAIAMENQVDLTVVGPEQPLAMGIVDLFQSQGLKIVGPTAKAALIEGSKAFAKDLMKANNVPTADFEVFEDMEAAKAYCRGRGPVVVKADGLAAGKGVFVCNDEAEAIDAVEQIMGAKAFGDSGKQVVIEERLEGQEVSLLAFTDGHMVLPLEAAQDHKAAFDGDAGPNTGGMGAYSPTPIFTSALKDEVVERIMLPVLRGMQKEGVLYKGILYAGLMLTADGPKVLEFNCRMGDPETQPLMMRMKSDIVPPLKACADGTLEKLTLEWKPDAAVCVVMAAGGYPGSYEKGHTITGIEQVASIPEAQVFHAGTKIDGDHIVTHGGRVLGVTALGADIEQAINNAYRAVDKIRWEGAHFRRDIGQKAVKTK